MKTISVILPLNNQEMLNQTDLEPYQSNNHYFKLSYIDTPLKELNNIIDASTVVPLVLQKIQGVAHEGVAAVIVYAFGDVGVKEARGLVSIPIMGLGKSAVHMASMLCRHRYTILPSMLNHNAFIEELVFEEGLQRKFIPASHSIELSPMQLRKNSAVLEKLVEVATIEYQEKGIDTFTLGCGCFINVAKKLEAALREKLQQPITVIDPVDVPFNLIKSLV